MTSQLSPSLSDYMAVALKLFAATLLSYRFAARVSRLKWSKTALRAGTDV
jgi:hypothetical protein